MSVFTWVHETAFSQSYYEPLGILKLLMILIFTIFSITYLILLFYESKYEKKVQLGTYLLSILVSIMIVLLIASALGVMPSQHEDSCCQKIIILDVCDQEEVCAKTQEDYVILGNETYKKSNMGDIGKLDPFLMRI